MYVSVAVVVAPEASVVCLCLSTIASVVVFNFVVVFFLLLFVYGDGFGAVL